MSMHSSKERILKGDNKTALKTRNKKYGQKLFMNHHLKIKIFKVRH